MSTWTHIHLEAEDEIEAHLLPSGTLCVEFGPHASLFIQKGYNPEQFAKWCEHFGIETAKEPALPENPHADLHTVGQGG